MRSAAGHCAHHANRRTTIAQLCLSLVVALLVSGCATRGSLDFSCAGFDEFAKPTKGSELDHAINTGEIGSSSEAAALTDDPISRDLLNDLQNSAAFARPGQMTPGILLLSGGGQWGAYGAAFLDTLRSRNELPQFNVVSGVSTGALQALFVGVGDTAAYHELIENYRPASETVIVSRNPEPLAVITGSFAGLKPLKRLVETELCDQPESSSPCMIDRLAALRVQRKHVLIGLVRAYDGKFLYVDAVEIANRFASNRRAARNCIVGAALASSAMPVTFQQVKINGRTFFDGGVRVSVFEGDLASRAQLAANAFENGGAITGSATNANGGIIPIYVVRNGRTVVQPPDDDPDTHGDAFTAAMRADNIVTNQLEVSSIAALRLAHPSGSIFLTSANGMACERPSGSMFHPQFMRCLQCLGRYRGRAERPWTELPPLDIKADYPAASAVLPGSECTNQNTNPDGGETRTSR